MDQTEVSIRYEVGEWVVRPGARSRACERFPTLEEAQTAAYPLARSLAPCWVRLHTEQGRFRMAYHLR